MAHLTNRRLSILATVALTSAFGCGPTTDLSDDAAGFDDVTENFEAPPQNGRTEAEKRLAVEARRREIAAAKEQEARDAAARLNERYEGVDRRRADHKLDALIKQRRAEIVRQMAAVTKLTADLHQVLESERGVEAAESFPPASETIASVGVPRVLNSPVTVAPKMPSHDADTNAECDDDEPVKLESTPRLSFNERRAILRQHDRLGTRSGRVAEVVEDAEEAEEAPPASEEIRRERSRAIQEARAAKDRFRQGGRSACRLHPAIDMDVREPVSKDVSQRIEAERAARLALLKAAKSTTAPAAEHTVDTAATPDK